MRAARLALGLIVLYAPGVAGSLANANAALSTRVRIEMTVPAVCMQDIVPADEFAQGYMAGNDSRTIAEAERVLSALGSCATRILDTVAHERQIAGSVSPDTIPELRDVLYLESHVALVAEHAAIRVHNDAAAARALGVIEFAAASEVFPDRRIADLRSRAEAAAAVANLSAASPSTSPLAAPPTPAPGTWTYSEVGDTCKIQSGMEVTTMPIGSDACAKAREIWAAQHHH